MRFHSLSVSNLRAIKRFYVEDLGDFVVVAGQNGSGKSCVFDAIRLLKSVYGGYSANEYHQWFGEFAINFQDKSSIRKLFRDETSPIVIEATISFAESEAAYIRDNIEILAQPVAWQEVTGQPVDPWTFSRIAIATQLRQLQPVLTEAVIRLSRDVLAELAKPIHTISLTIDPRGEMRLAVCKPAEIAFQAYEPEHLGVIEYHSASRSYSRQQVGGVNLDARSFENERRQQRLYNWQNKYQNIKTELATSYLRNLIAKESESPNVGDDLNETLAELFRTFFPDKTYEGVKPQEQGGLEFPVRLSSGETHDIDELSSGEKKILYGYLKLRNSTPKHSVILLDEPELHLNPSLLQGFTDFYYRHLGLDQGNQLWLVTHSDTLLRQAVGNMNYRVYQMLPAISLETRENQAVEVLADDDVERVTIDLVGDLASYRPHGKVVVLEGEVENGFDVTMVKRMFPDFARRVNLVSGGHKQRVRDLYSVLKLSAEQAGIKNRFFAIIDKDSDPQRVIESGASEFSWDVYHIENYLLDLGSVRSATATLLGNDPFRSDRDIFEALRSCAEELVDSLVFKRVQSEVNDLFVWAINISGPPDTRSPARAVAPSIEASVERIKRISEQLDADELERRSLVHRERFIAALASESWMKEFPGRLILRRYADKQLTGQINASLFLNAVLDKMIERRVKPEGMQTVLNAILAS